MNGSDATAAGLPFLRAPHDVLRDGLPTLKEDARVVHPVEAVQKQARALARSWRRGVAAAPGGTWAGGAASARALCVIMLNIGCVCAHG